jgi:predicted enzyme related to lactoylglutathione lyase
MMQYSEVYLALASRHVDALANFYGRLLGQTPEPWMPSRYAELRWPGLKLAIFCPGADHHDEFLATTNAAISLCIEVEELEEAIATLQSLGQAPTSPIINASHGREIYVRDPDGNRLILHQRNSVEQNASPT